MSKILEDLEAYGVDLAETMDRFVDDEELYLSCLETLREEPGFEDLKKGLDTKNVEMAFDAAHTLKGVVGNLGLTPLYNAICPVVESLRSGVIDGLDDGYSEIMAQKAKVDKILEGLG